MRLYITALAVSLILGVVSAEQVSRRQIKVYGLSDGQQTGRFRFRHDQGGAQRSESVKSGRAGGFVLTANSKCTVYIPQEAGRVLHFASKELTRYLREIIGAAVLVNDASQPVEADSVIVLGLDKNLTEEGFERRVHEGRIEITGGSERAVLYGVYDWLESVGCRWLAPGQDYVPRLDKLLAAAGESKTEPALIYRILFFADSDLPVELLDWMAKQRINYLFPHLYGPHGWSLEEWPPYDPEAVKDRSIMIIAGGHTMPEFLPPEKYYDRHPEYFPLLNGLRSRPGPAWQPCMSNPEVVEVLASNIIAFLKSRPEINVFSLWFNDSPGWCECASCRALQEYGERDPIYGGYDYSVTFFRFAKRVMERIKKDLPNMRFETGQGYAHRHAPSTELHIEPPGGTMFFIDHYVQCQRHPLNAPCNVGEMERLIKNWGPWYPLRNTYVWVYYHDQCKTPDLPLGLVHRVVKDARWAANKRLGGIACLNVVAPAWYFWQLYHLNFYALAKAWWDPSVDPEALIKDFCAHYYGKASEPMVRYYQLLEEVTAGFGEGQFKPVDKKWAEKLHSHGFKTPQAYLTRPILEQMCQEVDRALPLADDQVSRMRVQQTRDVLRLVELLWEAEENPQPARAKEIASEIRRITKVDSWPKQALRQASPNRRANRLLEQTNKQ